MKPIIEYGFEGQAVRVIDKSGEPWFVLSDLCRVIGIKNNRDAAERLDDDEKGVGLTDTLGGDQNMIVVNESGLYTVILRSKAAVTPGTAAHRFRKWVTADLIPAIRRDGVCAIGANGKSRSNSDRDAAKRRIPTMLTRLERTTNREARRVLHDLLCDDCKLCGIEPPNLALIGRDAPFHPGVTAPFWAALEALRARGIEPNAHRYPDRFLAVNPGWLKKVCAQEHINLCVSPGLLNALRRSPDSCFVHAKAVNTRFGRIMHCWVFALQQQLIAAE